MYICKLIYSSIHVHIDMREHGHFSRAPSLCIYMHIHIRMYMYTDGPNTTAVRAKTVYETK